MREEFQYYLWNTDRMEYDFHFGNKSPLVEKFLKKRELMPI